MDRTTLILVKPEFFDKERGDWYGMSEDKAQQERRWDEFQRCDKLLQEHGLEKDSNGSFCFELHGFNWQGKMAGELYTLSPSAIALLEGQAKRLFDLRQQALAKLSPEEQHALGILRQP